MYHLTKQYNPFIRKNDSVSSVMTDVIIALLPVVLMMWVAYGFTPVMVVLVSLGSALLAEFLFNRLFAKDTRALGDGSSIVTGMLMACTLGAFAPLPIVALGGASAVIFGKLLWGGLGQNRFNPALIGREFMVLLFPSIMNSGSIFRNPDLMNFPRLEVFGNEFWDNFVFKPSGAIGEFSPLLLIVGGLFLLWRRRISWRIPLAMIVAFVAMTFLFRDQIINFTLGGILLGAIYMATDMPTSASNHTGKIYFGAMTGICAVICLIFGATRGYLSYAILLMNAFVVPIMWVFRPRTWGKKIDIFIRVGQGVFLTIAIIVSMLAFLWLDNHDLLLYLLIFFTLYSILRFAFSEEGYPWGKLRKWKSKDSD